MEIKIKKLQEFIRETETKIIKLYNPAAIDHRLDHRVKSIELTDEFTRIDFLYQIPVDGWWISMEPACYIQTIGSTIKHQLIKAIGIPLSPMRENYWKKQTIIYTLIFPVLPKNTVLIDIIEKPAPGNYFNFFDVSFKQWMTVPHPIDVTRSNN